VDGLLISCRGGLRRGGKVRNGRNSGLAEERIDLHDYSKEVGKGFGRVLGRNAN